MLNRSRISWLIHPGWKSCVKVPELIMKQPFHGNFGVNNSGQSQGNAFNKKERKNKTAYFCKKLPGMKKWGLVILLIMLFSLAGIEAIAQCSVCTKTAQQLGEGPAKGMNSGILYLAFTPFAIVGYISYRWWKNHKPE